VSDAGPEGVRLDKWLQVARAFKTRTQATHACSLGRVRVNGERVKPHRSLRVGDLVEIESGDWTRVLVVQLLRDRPVAKAEAPALYEDRSPPRPVRDTALARATRQHARREPGTGRPTKRDRRLIDRLREGDN
jgi:ribosome-associated heat shock protein Hsp15